MNEPHDSFKIAINSIDYAKDINEVPFFDKPNNVLSKMMFSDKQVDLAYGTALYVSQGGNKNGYYFSRNLLLANYKSVLLKPINIGHTPEFIVGVTYDAALSKKTEDGEEPKFSLLEDSKIKVTDKGLIVTEGYKGPVEIWTHFALFRMIYPGLVETLKNNVSGNMETDEYFISMEVLFNDYKYLWEGDESTSFDRTAENRYLDDYIGKTFEGKRLYKMYIGPVIFGGGGIVGNPAEPRAVLTDIANRDVAATNLSVVKDGDLYKFNCLTKDRNRLNAADKEQAKSILNNSNKEEHNMEIDVAAITKSVEDKVVERVKILQTEKNLDQATATMQAQKEEINTLSTKLQDVSAAGDAALRESEESLQEVTTKLDEATQKVGTLEKETETLKENQMTDDDKKELAEYKAYKTAKTRMEDLASKKLAIPDEKKDEVFEKLGKFTDEQYDAYVSALEVAGAKVVEPGEGESGEADNANASQPTTPPVADPDKVLSNAASQPNANLQQDTAGAGDKRVKFMQSLKTVTTRSNVNPRGVK